MNDELRRRMAEAARLMGAGNLMDAAAAIRQALGSETPRAPPPTVAADDVIDVEARVVAPADDPVREIRRTARESFTAGHFGNDAGARDYRLFEPTRDGRALPLLLMLHGCTQDPDDFARGTRMTALARAEGFLVLYPAQSPRANAQGCWNWFKHNHQGRGRGEPAILAGLVREVMRNHAVDPARVYVAGLSAGGAMAAILGDAYPDLFAAVGVHSGLPTGSARDVQGALVAMRGGAPVPARPSGAAPAPPTIVFHGDADATVDPVNGERVLAAAGLVPAPVAHRVAPVAGVAATRRAWLDGLGVARGEQWTLHCAGHAWSGGDLAGAYADPRGPDASAEMLRFFLQHPRG